MQCKDIPTEPILEFIRTHKKCFLFPGFENSIGLSMPSETPEKMIRAKMAKLIKQGLVRGCACGCRGDFALP